MIYVATQKNLWELIPSEQKEMREVVIDLYANDRTAFERIENEVIDTFHFKPDEDEVSEYIVSNFKHLCTIADSRRIPDKYTGCDGDFFLDEKNIMDLLGKTIKWSAPAYPANEAYGGETIIESVDLTKWPSIKAKNIIGDNLEWAFVSTAGFDEKGNLSMNAGTPRAFCYSDEDRFVYIKEVVD